MVGSSDPRLGSTPWQQQPLGLLGFLREGLTRARVKEGKKLPRD